MARPRFRLVATVNSVKLRSTFGIYALSAIAFATLTAAFFTGLTGGFLTSLIILLMVNIVLAFSWAILHGYMGEFSFGQVVFFGIGQYTVALMRLYGITLNPLVNTLLGGCVSVIAALIIAHPLLRIRGWYFAIGTFAFSEIIRIIITAQATVTRGAAGILVTGKIPYDPAPDYVTALALAFGSVIVMERLANSNFGLALRSIKDNYDSAKMIGISPVLYRVMGFALSAALAGLAGGYYVQFKQYVDPTSAFDGTITFRMIVMSILGGSAYVSGPVVGASLILALEEIGRTYFLRGSLLLEALILVPTMIFMPGGIVGVLTGDLPIQNPFTKKRRE